MKDNEKCTVCYLSNTFCLCDKLCTICNGILLEHVKEGLPASNYCKCNLSYINTLKTKITSDNGLDISNDKQTSVKDLLDDKLDKNCIVPEEPGQDLDISHLDKHLQVAINKTYTKAWSLNKFYTGFFMPSRLKCPLSQVQLLMKRKGL